MTGERNRSPGDNDCKNQSGAERGHQAIADEGNPRSLVFHHASEHAATKIECTIFWLPNVQLRLHVEI
jgi:hypothetical protein